MIRKLLRFLRWLAGWDATVGRYRGGRFIGGPLDGQPWLPTNRNWNNDFQIVRLDGSHVWHHYARRSGNNWGYYGTVHGPALLAAEMSEP